MNAKALVLTLLLPTMAAAQGFAGLGTTADGFRSVTAPARLEFPADHSAHPGFRVEWWYLTANLTDADGADYGVQWTLFRTARTPGPEGEGWDGPLVWMGHAALTDAETHRFTETFARGGIGQAGVRSDPFEAWIDDWSMRGTPDLAELTVTARGTDFAYDLQARTDRPPVPQGDNGFSVKSEEGLASYYYSQPFYRIEGVISVEGRDIPVTGSGWLDREWSSQPLTEEQDGWDWFSLHLDDGAKVMLYRMRNRTTDPYVTGTWIAPDGKPTRLDAAAISLTPRRETEVAGRRVPTTWRIEIPGHGLAVDIEPLNAQSWMGTLFSYWEGPIRIAGSTSGRGYLEMTGYE